VSGAFCKVTSSRVAGGTGANARYILRESACDRWATRHVPDHARLGWDEREQKRALADHLDRQAELGRGARRNYRVILSFEKEVSSDHALRLADEFLAKSHFRDNPALLAVHRNTEHVHVHLLLPARKTDGYKLDLKRDQFESFDKLWARIYDRAMNRDHTRDATAARHRQAVGERQISLAEWRRRYGRLRRAGLAPAEIRRVIGERPSGRELTVAAVHIRRNEGEKRRITEHLQATRSALGRSAAGLGRPGRDPGPPERGTESPRRRERDAAPAMRGTATIVERTGRALRDDHRAAERGLAGFVRDVGGGLEREVARLVRAAGGRYQPLVRRAEQQLHHLEQQRRGRDAGPDRGRHLRDHCQGVRQRLGQRLGANAARLTFGAHVYPLLRTLEKYLDRLPEHGENIRRQFAAAKDRLWQRYTGRPWDFRREFELKRAHDPEIRFDRDLHLTRLAGKTIPLERLK